MALITEILCRIYRACLELISFCHPLSFLGYHTIYLVTTLPKSLKRTEYFFLDLVLHNHYPLPSNTQMIKMRSQALVDARQLLAMANSVA